MSDTIAALATAPGRAAVAILRLSGPDALNIAAALAGPLPATRQAALRTARDRQGQPIDQGLLLCFAAPASYTGEHVVEFQGHGGSVVQHWLLERVLELGARLARPGEFSERAFVNGRLDLAQAEAVADLIDAASRDAARAAQATLTGQFSAELQQLVDALIELRSYLEGALDFSDEDIDWLSEGRIGERLAALPRAIDALLARATQGRRLREGLRVALAGPPNAGKSTLMNHLAGEDVAIVADQPGTTRDVLREQILIGGMPLTLVDTAGLRDTTDEIEQEGIRRSRRELTQAELLIYVVDDREGISAADWLELAAFSPGLPRILVRNKCDLSGQPAGVLQQGADGSDLRISALDPADIELLRQQLLAAAGLGQRQEGLILARGRHLDALREARACCEHAAQALIRGAGAELAADDLRRAQQALDRITGRFSADDLLGHIFAGFCIGK